MNVFRGFRVGGEGDKAYLTATLKAGDGTMEAAAILRAGRWFQGKHSTKGF
jgi:hypothetical protein